MQSENKNIYIIFLCTLIFIFFMLKATVYDVNKTVSRLKSDVLFLEYEIDRLKNDLSELKVTATEASETAENNDTAITLLRTEFEYLKIKLNL